MRCPKCGKNSVVQKGYKRQRDGADCVAEYCSAGRCNYRKVIKEVIPVSPAGEYTKNDNTGQLSFKF